MPVMFVGHGNPMNAINHSRFAQTWDELGAHLPTPRAIVCMSAHWLTLGTYVSAHANPSILYDFYGFPPELYAVEYPARGDESISRDILTLEPAIVPDYERGLDHGVWSVLMHLFPKGDVPIIPLSIDFGHDRREQFELMKHLRPLRDAGVLFIGSGNIVHNLARMRTAGAYDWALSFDTQAAQLIGEGNHDALLNYETLGEAAQLSIPTDDHYRPMLNTLALTHTHESPTFFNTDIDLGSVGMRSFVITR